MRRYRDAVAPDVPPPAGRAGSEALLRADRAHVWHPYGPMPGWADPLVVAAASGVRLTLDDGRELVDGMSSWWAAVHGYRHPALDAAARAALDRMSHVMFGGLTHDPAVALATALVEITPEPLQHVFLADSARCRSRSLSRCACSTSGPAAAPAGPGC